MPTAPAVRLKGSICVFIGVNQACLGKVVATIGRCRPSNRCIEVEGSLFILSVAHEAFRYVIFPCALRLCRQGAAMAQRSVYHHGPRPHVPWPGITRPEYARSVYGPRVGPQRCGGGPLVREPYMQAQPADSACSSFLCRHQRPPDVSDVMPCSPVTPYSVCRTHK